MSYKHSWVYFTCNKWVSTYLQLQINNHNEVFDVHATRSSYQTFKVNNGIPKYWIDNLITTHNFCDAYAVTHVLAIYHQASTVDTIVPWAAGHPSHTEQACKLTTCPLVSISVLLAFPGLFQVVLLLSPPTRTFGNNWSSFFTRRTPCRHPINSMKALKGKEFKSKYWCQSRRITLWVASFFI